MVEHSILGAANSLMIDIPHHTPRPLNELKEIYKVDPEPASSGANSEVAVKTEGSQGEVVEEEDEEEEERRQVL